MAKSIARILPPLMTFLAVTLAAEIITRATHAPAFLFPRPSAVLRTILYDRDGLAAAFWNTSQAAVMGFAASAVLGILLALALASSRLLRRAIFPYTVFFQTVPVVAIAPLLVIWLDPGLLSVTVSTLIVAIFPVITNTLTGLLSTDPALEDLFTLYGSGRLARLLKLRFPSALPSIFSGLRVAAGLAVIGTIVSEALVGQIVRGEGLGAMLRGANQSGRADRVFALVLLSSILGLVLFGAVNLAGKLLLKAWRQPCD